MPANHEQEGRGKQISLIHVRWFWSFGFISSSPSLLRWSATCF